MSESAEISNDFVTSHLSIRLLERDRTIEKHRAAEYVSMLVPEARTWLERMTLDKMGCRPLYSDGHVVGAMLCDHTVNGCDCGEHKSEEDEDDD